MSTYEKLCIQWNDFQDDVSTSLECLREDKDFVDVTLVCQDGQLFDAHKIILSMSSPFFQNILKRNKHAHPLIYMRGVKPEDLKAILDFLYYGEATILKLNLESFYTIAQELNLKGWSKDAKDKKISELPEEIKPETETTIDSHYQPDSISQAKEMSIDQSGHEFLKTFQEIDRKLNTMMSLSSSHASTLRPYKKTKCNVCGKEDRRNRIKEHIETKHIQGISLPCPFCEKNLRSRADFRRHKLNYHSSQKIAEELDLNAMNEERDGKDNSDPLEPYIV